LSGSCTSVRRIPEAYETIPGHGFYHLTMLPHRQLAIRSIQEGVRVWDNRTGLKCYAIKLPRVRDVLGLPDGRLVACVDHLIHVYRDSKLLITRRCHKKSIVTKLQTVGARYMASGGQDDSVNIWNTDTMTCVRVISQTNPYIFDVVSDGNLVTVSTEKERRIKAYDLEQDSALARTDTTCSSVVCGLGPLDNGQLMSFHWNGEVYIWS
jgi:WD40 repeat protein